MADGKSWTEQEREFQASVRHIVDTVNDKVASRAQRAANELRNAAMQVLRGERSGRVYKKPGTYGKKASKTTRSLKGRYGHKLRGGQLYRASAPGEAPTVRGGTLRLSWEPIAAGAQSGKRYKIVSAIRTDIKYAPILQNGSARMAPRPYREKIIEMARPKITKIFGGPYK